MEDIRSILQVKIESPYWDEAYEMALAEPEIPCWLDSAFLTKMQEEGFLTNVYDGMAKAADALLQVKELVLLAKVIKNIMAYKNPKPTGFHDTYIVRKASDAFAAFELPKAPGGADPLPYETLCVFPFVAHLIQWIEHMQSRGVDEDVVRKTTNYWCGAVVGSTAEPISAKNFMNYPATIYRDECFINHLRFQLCPGYTYRIRVFANEKNELVVMPDEVKMHRSGHTWGTWLLDDEDGAYYATVTEDDTHYEGHVVDQNTYLAETQTTRLSKEQWRQVYQAGDDLVRIHIAGAAGFKRDLCEEAIDRARELFARCFPEYDFRGITAYSWFMGPELIPVLKPESNLYQFRQMFTMFPSVAGPKDAFYYIYGIEGKEPSQIDIDALPEDNSLRRGIKAQMKKGYFLRNHGGFLPFK